MFLRLCVRAPRTRISAVPTSGVRAVLRSRRRRIGAGEVQTSALERRTEHDNGAPSRRRQPPVRATGSARQPRQRSRAAASATVRRAGVACQRSAGAGAFDAAPSLPSRRTIAADRSRAIRRSVARAVARTVALGRSAVRASRAASARRLRRRARSSQSRQPASSGDRAPLAVRRDHAALVADSAASSGASGAADRRRASRRRRAERARRARAAPAARGRRLRSVAPRAARAGSRSSAAAGEASPRLGTARCAPSAGASRRARRRLGCARVRGDGARPPGAPRAARGVVAGAGVAAVVVLLGRLGAALRCRAAALRGRSPGGNGVGASRFDSTCCWAAGSGASSRPRARSAALLDGATLASRAPAWSDDAAAAGGVHRSRPERGARRSSLRVASAAALRSPSASRGAGCDGRIAPGAAAAASLARERGTARQRLVHRPVPPHQADQRRCHARWRSRPRPADARASPRTRRADARAARAARDAPATAALIASPRARFGEDRFAQRARRRAPESGAWRSASRSQASRSASFDHERFRRAAARGRRPCTCAACSSHSAAASWRFRNRPRARARPRRGSGRRRDGAGRRCAAAAAAARGSRAAFRRRGARTRGRRLAARRRPAPASAATPSASGCHGSSPSPRSKASTETSRPLLRSRSMTRWCASVKSQVRKVAPCGCPALARVDDAQPRVLEHLVGLRRERCSEQAPHEAVERRLVAPVQLLEGGRVAVRVGLHQRVVARCRCWPWRAGSLPHST